MEKKNLFLIFLLFAFLGCKNEKEIKYNDNQTIVGYIDYNTFSYKVSVQKKSLTSNIEIAREFRDRGTILFYDKVANLFIEVYANPKGFFGDYKIPNKHSESPELLLDHTNHKFHGNGKNFYTFVSDSLKAYVKFAYPDSLYKREIKHSYTNGFIRALSIKPLGMDEKENFNHFTIPQIKTVGDTFTSFYWDQPTRLNNPPIFKGIFKFDDTIYINTNTRSMIKYFKSSSFYITPPMRNDGFLIFENFKDEVGIWINSFNQGRYYYPLFIVNETSHILELPISSKGVVITQEVKLFGRFEREEWVPIENKPKIVNDRMYLLVIPPCNYACFLLPKYNGNCETSIRSRIYIGNNIYVSKRHDGSINPELLK